MTNALYIGDVIGLKIEYLNSKFKYHLLDVGIITRKTPTDFVVIQDIHGNDNYMKITELVKLIPPKQEIE